MLKTLSTKLAKSEKGGIGVGGNNRARRDSKCNLDKKETGNNEIDKKLDNEIRKKGQKMS